MSRGLANVIAAHHGYQHEFDAEDIADTVTCECGERLDQGELLCPTERDDLHAAHLAEVLAQAGYRDVQEAKTEALTEAAAELARFRYAKPEAPGRAEYERMLAIRRGGTDAWLRERADRIKGEA